VYLYDLSDPSHSQPTYVEVYLGGDLRMAPRPVASRKPL
jgi:hypothetical protein